MGLLVATNEGRPYEKPVKNANKPNPIRWNEQPHYTPTMYPKDHGRSYQWIWWDPFLIFRGKVTVQFLFLGVVHNSRRKGSVWLLSVVDHCDNCTIGNHLLQLSCLLLTKIVMNSFISWFTCSVCPSVCGWYAVDGFPWIPKAPYNSFMNRDTNCVPWSLITFIGNLWSQKTWLMKCLAIPFDVTVAFVGKKYAYFEKRSTTTMIISYPWESGSISQNGKPAGHYFHFRKPATWS